MTFEDLIEDMRRTAPRNADELLVSELFDWATKYLPAVDAFLGMGPVADFALPGIANTAVYRFRVDLCGGFAVGFSLVDSDEGVHFALHTLGATPFNWFFMIAMWAADLGPPPPRPEREGAWIARVAGAASLQGALTGIDPATLDEIPCELPMGFGVDVRVNRRDFERHFAFSTPWRKEHQRHRDLVQLLMRLGLEHCRTDRSRAALRRIAATRWIRQLCGGEEILKLLDSD